MEKLPQEFRMLVHKGLDGSLTPSEVREIEAVMLRDPQARRWYAEVALLHNDLIDQCGANELCKRLHEEFPESAPNASPSVRLREGGGSASWPLTRRIMSRWSAVAAVLLLSMALGCGVGIYAASVIYIRPAFAPAPWDWQVAPDVVARIDSTFDAVWQPSDVPDTLPTTGLRVGQQIRLEAGLVSLSFQSGEGVILQGPAVFEIRSERGGKLFSGRLSLHAFGEEEPYVVATPVGDVSCGSGHFGIEVRNDEAASIALFHAISGPLQEGPAAHVVANNHAQAGLELGESCIVDFDGRISRTWSASPGEFADAMPAKNHSAFDGDVIPLGNLFDDSKTASLAEAVRSDAFQAAGETIDLGVAAVIDGSLDVDVPLAEEGVKFNFNNVGGGGARVRGLPSNDTTRSVGNTPIRTLGTDFEEAEIGLKAEDGVGMCTNELLTFDLDELRDAGLLGDKRMRFVADRVGLNDRGLPPHAETPVIASARFIVVVSTEETVLAGYVDGKPYPVARHGDVHHFDLQQNSLPSVLRRDGRFVSFDVPLPAEARFLTLATTMHDVEHDDHAVFSGARLEILPGRGLAATPGSDQSVEHE